MITGEERLRENLTDLYSNLVFYDGGPSQTQIERADAVARELGDVQRISTPGRHGSCGDQCGAQRQELEPIAVMSRQGGRRQVSRRVRYAALVAIAVLAACRSTAIGSGGPPPPPPPPGPAPALHVQGNQLVDNAGRVVRLKGVIAPEPSTPARRVGFLRRPVGLRVRGGDRVVEGQRGPRAAQRDLLARDQRRHARILRCLLSSGISDFVGPLNAPDSS